MIQTFEAVLPHGITLSCRSVGSPTLPVLVFLHGFPEGAFVWDHMLEHFGDRYRCIAPNLRGFERSSAPDNIEAYRAKHLVADIVALIDQQAAGRVEALVAHDWGGAVAWNIGAQRPEKLKRLVIINSPHPATFLRDLKRSEEQQRASAYMNFLCRPDAEALLAADDFARLWPFFTGMGAADGQRVGGGWLTEPVRAQYRALWSLELRGGCNYYRASPLRPPTPQDQKILSIEFPAESVTVKVPTRVIWAEDDLALPVGLLDGLNAFVPELHLVRVPGASHWIIHERPGFVSEQIELALGSG
jgi:pimeloyl-ACP methyl ester carboxylesterase